MSEMVARVAMIVASVDEQCGSSRSNIVCIKQPNRCACRETAREIIKAMREPTEAMCAAANALEDQPWRDKGEREDGPAHWRAMMDEALK